MKRVETGALAYYRNPDWSELRHGVFTRRGGLSSGPWASLNVGASNGDDPAAVRENQRLMLRAAQVNPERVYSCWLTHSVDALVIDGEARRDGPLPKADALLTDSPDTALVMRFADCVPLLYYDPARRAIALGHAGWRGTVRGMAGKIVREMRAAFGCRPADIEVLIGPAISRRNYRVGDEVACQAEAYFGRQAGVVWRDPPEGSPHLDLWRANQLDLEREGVTKLQTLEICTFENTRDFFSHRAERGKTGRFGVVISL